MPSRRTPRAAAQENEDVQAAEPARKRSAEDVEDAVDAVDAVDAENALDAADAVDAGAGSRETIIARLLVFRKEKLAELDALEAGLLDKLRGEFAALKAGVPAEMLAMRMDAFVDSHGSDAEILIRGAAARDVEVAGVRAPARGVSRTRGTDKASVALAAKPRATRGRQAAPKTLPIVTEEIAPGNAGDGAQQVERVASIASTRSKRTRGQRA